MTLSLDYIVEASSLSFVLERKLLRLVGEGVPWKVC
jgi:hypothetical protein